MSRILEGNAQDVLKTLPDQSVQMCVTSPPYFGLRDYGVAGQLGLEATPDEYVSTMVEVFREVRRVLRDDGTLWLNIGDSYNGSGKGGVFSDASAKQATNHGANIDTPMRLSSCKPKDLIGIPWLLAFALRADGWYLRQDIIWAKPNPMPESVTDRCTKAHEYLFLLTKSARYYYDAVAIAEPVTLSTVERLSQPTYESQNGSDRVPGKTNGNMKAVIKVTQKRSGNTQKTFRGTGRGNDESASVEEQSGIPWEGTTRNKRSVWTITTQPYKEAHFATFPPKLVEPCILAGSKRGDTVLDPFSGAGTSGLVASRLGREYVGIELNADYAEMSRRRIHSDCRLFEGAV